MTSTRHTILPALLSGSTAQGLWPLARSQAPAQFQPVFGDRSPLQEAAAAFADRSVYQPMIVVADAAHRFHVAQQLLDIQAPAGAILLEPERRGPLAALAAAVAFALDDQPETPMLVTPGEQGVRPQDRPALRRALATAARDALAGHIVRFATAPRPWLRNRGPLGDGFVDAGWLMATPKVFAEQIQATTPDVWHAAAEAVRSSRRDLDFLRLDEATFTAAPRASIANLIAAAGDATTIHALDFAPITATSWADVRAARTDACDRSGNLAEGDALLVDARNCFVRSEDRLAVVAGLEDVAVVVTDDAVLVTRTDRDAEMAVASELAATGRPEADAHPMERRPWGAFKRLTHGPRYQVKRITVAPGGATSLQMHHHRAEHWVVVAGVAKVTVDGTDQILQENQAAYLPLGCAHRVANPGKIPLELIEVQSGAYLGEDDIVRLDDPYGREAIP